MKESKIKPPYPIYLMFLKCKLIQINFIKLL